MSLFWSSSRAAAKWLPAGPISDFPDVGTDDGNVIQSRRCDEKMQPGCKIFHVPKADVTQMSEVIIPAHTTQSPSSGAELQDQVVVFRYKGKIHAVDHVSGQHQAFQSRRLTCSPSRVRTLRIRFQMARPLTLKILASF